LTPAPSPLVATAKSLPAADIYWIIRNGIKMSGMPAWQYRLSDKEIWDVVAFLKVLPSLTPADYQTWRGRYPLKQTQPENAQTSPSAKVRLGDVSAGKKALQQHLCITCHVIPGVVGPNRLIGPPLAGIASRQYIAGVLPNTPENMVRWIRNPTEVDPLTAMPDLNVSEQDAHDIAAFLSTLREQ
jgi:mono/diheme cytochrome c family protein